MYLYLGKFDESLNSANIGLELIPNQDKIDKLNIRKNEAIISIQILETIIKPPNDID